MNTKIEIDMNNINNKIIKPRMNAQHVCAYGTSFIVLFVIVLVYTVSLFNNDFDHLFFFLLLWPSILLNIVTYTILNHIVLRKWLKRSSAVFLEVLLLIVLLSLVIHFVPS